MAKSGKQFVSAKAKVEDKSYSIQDAIPLVQSLKYSKFDETVELVMRLGVDPKHADQMVRGTVVLPHGLGRSKKVVVIANGEKQKEATGAGADEVGGEDVVAKIQGGWMDFEAVVATPDMMAVVGRLGKVLGPRGLMPNPKLGTVTPDVETAVKAAKGGEVTFRAEKAGVVHAGIGKASFSEEQLSENLRAFVKAISNAKPSGAKGTYIKKVFVSSTMGPGMSVEVGSATDAA